MDAAESSVIDRDWYYGEETSSGSFDASYSFGSAELHKPLFSDVEGWASQIPSNHENINGFDYFEYNRQLINKSLEVVGEI